MMNDKIETLVSCQNVADCLDACRVRPLAKLKIRSSHNNDEMSKTLTQDETAIKYLAFNRSIFPTLFREARLKKYELLES